MVQTNGSKENLIIQLVVNLINQYSCIIQYYLGMINSSQNSQIPNLKSFREGMTLNEYLSTMQTLPKQDEYEEQKPEENLYETSQQKVQQKGSKKIITYEIRQSDQDDYDQSVQSGTHHRRSRIKKTEPYHDKDLKVSTRDTMFNLQEIEAKVNKINNRDFRVRRQSNSPYRQPVKQVMNFSPGKIFSQTLHSNNNWRIHRQPEHKAEVASSTIYGKFLKGFKAHEKQPSNMKPTEKQKYFKKKNTQEMEHLAKYEKQMFEKYERFQMADLISMRIDGVQDRLYERKIFNGRKIK